MGSTGSQGIKRTITKQATQSDFIEWANNKAEELNAGAQKLSSEVFRTPYTRANRDIIQKKQDDAFNKRREADALFRGKTIISRNGRISGYEPIPDATRTLFENETGMQLSDGDWNALRNRWTSKFAVTGQ